MGGKNFDVSGISGSDLTLTSWAGKTRVRQGEREGTNGRGRGGGEGQQGVGGKGRSFHCHGAKSRDSVGKIYNYNQTNRQIRSLAIIKGNTGAHADT